MERRAIIIASFALCAGLSGCASLRELDSRVGRFVSGEILGEKQDTGVEETVPETIASTTIGRHEQEAIDFWLKQNGYNRYGDRADTFYASGTPLGNPPRERYDYILERHPDILSKINY